jgi:hypothetical protein
VREFRKNTFRWAIKEARIITVEEENSPVQGSEQASKDNLQRDYELDEFLRCCRSKGLLSEADYKLLLQFQCEGFEAMELARGSTWRSAKAVYHRLEKILGRLRRAAAEPNLLKAGTASKPLKSPKRKKFKRGAEFRREFAHLVIVRRDSHRSFPTRCLKSEPMRRRFLCDIRSTDRRHRSHPLT